MSVPVCVCICMCVCVSACVCVCLCRENFVPLVSPEACPLVQSFLVPSRAFLGHAHVQLKTGLQTQERDLLLFTDTLLIAKAK